MAVKVLVPGWPEDKTMIKLLGERIKRTRNIVMVGCAETPGRASYQTLEKLEQFGTKGNYQFAVMNNEITLRVGDFFYAYRGFTFYRL